MDGLSLLQAIIWGLALGAIFALIALGYTLVYGIIELINFAHGDLFMLGSFLSLTLVSNLVFDTALVNGRARAVQQLFGVQLFLVLLLVLVAAMLFCGLLNVLIERLAYRRLRHAPRLAPLISAIGVSFILINIGQLWKGNGQRDFPNLLPDINVLDKWFGLTNRVSLSTKDLIVIGTAIPLMLGLTTFIQHTKLGKAMRATAQDREAAALMGIDINRTISLTFLLGGMLAGAAGLIYGLYTTQVWYLQGFRLGLIAFTAAVFGGVGNVRGAALGGFLIGLVASLNDLGIATAFPVLKEIPVLSVLEGLDAKWTLAVIFGMLILVLVFRPSGLLGERVVEKA
jgi:branched-chain amino acid transport system permease protein